MKNTLMYVLIAIAVLALGYKFAYPKAPAQEMIAKVGESARNLAVSGVAVVPAVAPNPSNDGVYTIDSGAVITWLGKKVGGSHPGQISFSEGMITVKDGIVLGGKVVMDMKTIKTTDDAGKALDDKLMNADWFDVATFPIGEFAINSVSNGMIQGDLILKGITKEIAFPGTVTVTADGVKVVAKTNIDRTLWNISGGKGMVDNFIELSFDINFTKKK